jgi:hypothetical protein
LRLFVFCHKPLSPIVFPDGSESQHIIDEGLPCPDAVKLQQWAISRHIIFCHGHYHGWTLMNPIYGDVIVDGRGDAVPTWLYLICYPTRRLGSSFYYIIEPLQVVQNG